MTTDIKRQFWDSLDSSPFVMVSLTGTTDHAIPMNAQLDENARGHFWFFTSRDNRLAPGGPAMIHFAAKGHDLFACIAATLVEEGDHTVLDRLWNNSIAAWYDGGKDDPNLLLLRAELGTAEIWEAQPSVKGIFKLLTGARMKDRDLGDHAGVSLANG